ncbi:restriction endonuclease subunit S [Mesomycoplasma hyorhinis]|uniref:restriction endonuclease subunit S n=1 Tax=Mesomycoplasma hyorhinis TaxID=2100 RepID=UPI001C03C76D|nr:restriction endonuclease subunit S [Mesomycoplasma hyorhinis]
MFEYASEGGTPSTANKSFYANEIPFVKIEDTNQKYILKTNSYISELGLNNSSAWLIPKNNIIFTTGATIGNVSINKILTATKQGIVGAIIKKTFDLEYVYYLLSSNTFQEKVHLNSSTGTFSSLALSAFLNLPVVILSNRFEQEKIGRLFYTLDKIVSLYERKISLFEKLQKYFLQNMFVKEKEGKPNVRFNKFDTLWTQKNIEDNFIIDGGGFVSKQEIKNNPGQYPVYSSQTSNNGKMGSINYYKYDGEFITWTTRGALAGSIFYRNEKFNVSNAGLLQAKDNQLSDVKFYYYVLKNSNLRTIMTIGSIPQFTVQMIKNINCLIPDNKDEQEQISNFLTHIDITHAQLKRKLNLIKNIQKSLLNKMFV